jgi:hypothetical protein
LALRGYPKTPRVGAPAPVQPGALPCVRARWLDPARDSGGGCDAPLSVARGAARNLNGLSRIQGFFAPFPHRTHGGPRPGKTRPHRGASERPVAASPRVELILSTSIGLLPHPRSAAIVHETASNRHDRVVNLASRRGGSRRFAQTVWTAFDKWTIWVTLSSVQCRPISRGPLPRSRPACFVPPLP